MSDFHLQSGVVNQLKAQDLPLLCRALGMRAHVSNPLGIKDLKEERTHE